MKKHIIGIVSGVGPDAGVDLHKKIIQNTNAATDQQHVSVIHISESSTIGDRTHYLKNRDIEENPAHAIFNVIKKLYHAGASVIGIPCNSAHAHPIFSVLEESVMCEFGDEIILVNMIQEVRDYIVRVFKVPVHGDLLVGLLATIGTYDFNTYPHYFAGCGVSVLYPETDEAKKRIHDSIYHAQYGIKTCANPVSDDAIRILHSETDELVRCGAQAVILGCTEIPLAFFSKDSKIAKDYVPPVPLIDASEILARALIKCSAPDKLRY